MKCEKCLYKDIVSVPDDEAFDVPDKRMIATKNVNYCSHNIGECEDVYSDCEYRDITVEAQHIQHAINLLTDKTNIFLRTNISNAIDYLNKILNGEEL